MTRKSKRITKTVSRAKAVAGNNEALDYRRNGSTNGKHGGLPFDEDEVEREADESASDGDDEIEREDEQVVKEDDEIEREEDDDADIELETDEDVELEADDEHARAENRPVRVEVGPTENRGRRRTVRCLWGKDGEYQGRIDTADGTQREKFIAAVADEAKVKLSSLAYLGAEILRRANAADKVAESSRAGDTSGNTYTETDAGIVWLKPTRSGVVPTSLTNFTAKISADIVEDDGVETRTTFEIEAAVGKRRKTFVIPASDFPNMSWAVDQLGARAIVSPGMGLRDHARAAIQLLSGKIPRHYVFTHTGWRRLKEHWAYLHSDGAVGPKGPVNGVGVSLSAGLSEFILPSPPSGDALKEAVLASLGILDVITDEISIPLLVAAYRAAVCPCDFSVHETGPSGTFKTELAALIQQHFGAGLDSRKLLGSWLSTGNSLEAMAFTLKDTIFVVDDFAPAGNKYDIARMHRDAERLLRAQGNNAARGRMRSDCTLRPSKPPRGLILSTGEDIFRGHSIRARTLILEVSPGAVNLEHLTKSQKHAAAGLMSQSMAGFIQWLAADYEKKVQQFRQDVVRRRDLYGESTIHSRTPTIIANLESAWSLFLQFARERKVLTRKEAEALRDRGAAALEAIAAVQGQHLTANDPVARFLELLSSAIASGRAHLADGQGNPPTEPQAWGWRQERSGEHLVWKPQGDRVGWLDQGNVYLEPEAAYAAVQKIGNDAGDGISLSSTTIRKRLHERHLLVTTDEKRGKLTVRRTLAGKRRDVLHIKRSALHAPETAQSAQKPSRGAK